MDRSYHTSFVLEVDLEYPKDLDHDDFPLTSDQIEINEKMLPSYQLKITDPYNIPIGNARKLGLNVFEKKDVLHYENLQLHLNLGLKLKKTHHVLEFSQSQWLKPYVKFNKKKERIEAEKNGYKDEKTLCKLTNNV